MPAITQLLSDLPSSQYQQRRRNQSRSTPRQTSQSNRASRQTPQSNPAHPRRGLRNRTRSSPAGAPFISPARKRWVIRRQYPSPVGATTRLLNHISSFESPFASGLRHLVPTLRNPIQTARVPAFFPAEDAIVLQRVDQIRVQVSDTGRNRTIYRIRAAKRVECRPRRGQGHRWLQLDYRTSVASPGRGITRISKHLADAAAVVAARFEVQRAISVAKFPLRTGRFPSPGCGSTG